MAKWDHRKFGTLADPTHKSDLSKLIGDFACSEAFRRDKQRELDGGERTVAYAKTEMGTATHEVIARVLRSDVGRKALAENRPITVDRAHLQRALDEEFQRAVGGREVVWRDDKQDELVAERLAMLTGLFADVHRHVAEVVACEAGWIAKIGEVWCEGHIDLVYRPRGLEADALAITDWKTGQRPHQIELDHGFESGLYSAAVRYGLFLPQERLESWRWQAGNCPRDVPLPLADVIAISQARTDRDAMHIALRALARMRTEGEAMPEGVLVFERFPASIRLTCLAEYVPYARAGKKKVERVEELEHWSRLTGLDLTAGTEVKYTAGMQRGPAWYRVRRTEHDVTRLEKRLRTIVSWVRFGLFVDAVGEKCTRCPHRDSCLTSGYEARGNEADALKRALRVVDLDGLDQMEL